MTARSGGGKGRSTATAGRPRERCRQGNDGAGKRQRPHTAARHRPFPSSSSNVGRRCIARLAWNGRCWQVWRKYWPSKRWQSETTAIEFNYTIFIRKNLNSNCVWNVQLGNSACPGSSIGPRRPLTRGFVGDRTMPPLTISRISLAPRQDTRSRQLQLLVGIRPLWPMPGYGQPLCDRPERAALERTGQSTCRAATGARGTCEPRNSFLNFA